MKFPAQLRTICPYCKTHTTQKLSVVKKRERGTLKGGQRRYLSVVSGYRGFPRPKVDPVKQTKRIDLRLKCPECKKMHVKTKTFRAKKFELKR